ncbi:hypothetical protein C3V36_07170 [Lachnospiraceae bacterium oral taxon 500]|nr:hypothetical protein C3V36_00055 [Lachnospiraceae bacterium oral taxon 500]AVM69036.1 hypothetical protein C3V36_07170 [Lachnospiraceae bacterium oral taxon 500]
MAGNRKHSIIDGLPVDLKEAVEMMIRNDFTYKEIVDFIRQSGFDISIASVWRHAKGLKASLQSLRLAQENFRAIAEEMDRYPDLDTTEGMVRLLSHLMMERVQTLTAEELMIVSPDKLLTQINNLVRTAAYKKNLDLKNQDILEAGYEKVNKTFFDALAKERPDLYAQVSDFLNEKKQEEKK